MNEAVVVKELSKTFNKKKVDKSGATERQVKAVDALNLTVLSGEIYGFLGLNGAGKTTTIKVLLGYHAPTSGTAHIFGEDSRNPQSRRRLGFAPERASFYDYLNARETLEFLGELSGLTLKVVRERIPQLLELVALGGEAETMVRNFSKGMQQRLGIAQSLLAQPDLLIFDEPTTGLDPLGRKIFKDLVLRLKSEGRTIFFSSHQLPDVQEICDRVGIIHHGKLVYEGPVAQLVQAGGTLESRFIDLLAEVDRSTGKTTRIE